MVPFPPFFLVNHQLIDLLILVLNHSWSFWPYVSSIFCLCNIINKMFIVLFSRHFVNTSWFVGKYKSVLLSSYFLISGDSILWNLQFILLNSCSWSNLLCHLQNQYIHWHSTGGRFLELDPKFSFDAPSNLPRN